MSGNGSNQFSRKPRSRGDGITERARYRITRLVGWKFSGNVRLASEKIGVPYFPLYRFLSKRSSLPSLELLESVARYFNMTFDELVAPDTTGIKRKEVELGNAISGR